MLDKFSMWRWQENANCWDFVREYAIDVLYIPAIDVPKFGALSVDKRATTKAYRDIKSAFLDSPCKHGAIACHFRGKLLIHVGVVVGDRIYHCQEGGHAKKDKIRAFEAMAETRYWLHNSLWHI